MKSHSSTNLKFIFHRDHLLTTLSIIVISTLFILIPVNTSFFDPISRAFSDFRLSDLYMQFVNSNKKPQSNEVFVVDISPLRDRSKIAAVLKDIAHTKPKEIVLDVIFEHSDGDYEDFVLQETIDTIGIPMIAAEHIDKHNLKKTSFFSQACGLTGGYINTVYDNTYSQCLRIYTTSQQVNGKVEPSLAQAAAYLYDGKSYEEDKQRLINYSDVKIKIIDHRQIGQYSALLKDKIVVVGIASGSEDRHLSPIGDISGPEIVAYSIYTIINDRYMREMAWPLAACLGLILCYAFVILCSRIHLSYPQTDNIRMKFLQFSAMVVLVFLSLIVSQIFNYEMNLTYAFVGLVLVGDTLLLYIGVLNWLNEKKFIKNPHKSLFL